jgi:hypothetical protein
MPLRKSVYLVGKKDVKHLFFIVIHLISPD